MLSRQEIQRRLLRLAIADYRSSDCVRTQAMVVRMLADEAIFETVYQRAMQEAAVFGHATGMLVVAHDTAGAPIVDSLLGLLRWFTLNQPTVHEIIRQISELFGND